MRSSYECRARAVPGRPAQRHPDPVYTTQSQWAGGFVAGITITNTGSSAINGWTLGFTFPGDQKITTAWNGTVTQSGANVTIANASYNGSIAAGGNTSVGFQGTWASS